MDRRFEEMLAWLETMPRDDQAVVILRGLYAEFQRAQKRKRGRPRKPTLLSNADFDLLQEAGSLKTAAIRGAVERRYRAGQLSRTTALDSHVKRLVRTVKTVRTSPEFPRLLAKALARDK